MTAHLERRHDLPRRLVVSAVDRAIARLPAHTRMTGGEAVDVLLDLRRSIEVIGELPWGADADARRGTALARRRRRRRRTI